MIDELVEKYLTEKAPKKPKTPFDKIRKPIAPPTQAHDDDNKYSRKKKHKITYE